MVNFYNRFLPLAAQLMRPLYNALRGRRLADVLDWSTEMTAALDAAKTAVLRYRPTGRPPRRSSWRM